ncbi:MAG: hypothetical protein ACT4P6_18440 [Gemmatimonadaceae bacterium]
MRHPDKRNVIVATTIALLVAPLAPNATAEGQESERFLYVVKMTGKWRALTGSASADLKLLGRVRTDARLQLDEADGEVSSIVLRDPRTLATRSLECSAERPCGSTSIPVSGLRPVVSGISRNAITDALYADLGESEKIRDRIRLVGARGSDRDIGILLLAYSGARVDIREISAKVNQPAERLVVRFCSLTDDAGDIGDCLESRALMPNDCHAASRSCDVKNAGAYRVDVYMRERSMLGSVTLASGFAALVPVRALTTASATRDSLINALDALTPALGDDERRALSAAATLAIAGIKR